MLVSGVVLLVWAERRPIATRFIDRELAARHVRARYAITDLGLGRQRLTDVVIGDPRAPDLTADWIETRVAFGIAGPHLAAVSAGNVRLNARLVGSRVSLGTIDRLLPAPSGKPFALPSLTVAVQDARVRLTTPAGPVGLRLTGQGRLDDGFRGTLAAAAPRLALAGCTVAHPRGAVRLTIDAAARTMVGPVRAAALACAGGTARTVSADLNVALGAALDSWRGDARVRTGSVAVTGASLDGVAGTIRFAGTPRAPLAGDLNLIAAGATARGVRARRVTALGGYDFGSDRSRFLGRISGGDVRLAVPLPDPRALAGTPVGPLAQAATEALARAVRRFDLDATLAIVATNDLRIGLDDATIRSASGVRVLVRRGDGIGWWPRTGTARFDGTVAVAGGGLPEIQATLRQPALAPVRGTVRMTPYSAGGATLALAPAAFAFTPGGGAGRIDTTATLSGPLGDGRVEALTLPIRARWSRDTVTLNPRCTPVSFQRLALAGLTLDPARLTLCPTSPALVRVAAGRVDGGARLGPLRLAGRLGATPLTLAARGGAVDLAARGFSVDGLAARLGAADRQTRLDADRLTGTLAAGVVTGGFTGAAGQIANVPLLLSRGQGGWRLANGALALTGTLAVADAAAAPRFRPLDAREVALTLVDGRIAAGGMLYEPTTGTAVARVALDHRLATGTGAADLAVPALTFGDGFQPDLLTPLTFGVIADVKGRVDGRGHIAWSPTAVTSTGDFGTAGLDLAAAFGPVTGIAGRLRFDDLLGLHTPPGQAATVKSVNPGIAVQDGSVRYQLLGGTRVQVEGATWPFAGGTLTLDPTLLDFDAEQARRLTFRVESARADQFLQQFAFDNLNATGTFDGVLPMIFDQSGGRIEDGRLAMRAGGGTIAYVGALGQEQLGVWGDLAFQALKSLRYRSLALKLNGPLAGEMVTDVRFDGISQGQGAKSNFLIRRLQRLPFVFNIRIRAPFRGLIDSAASFYDPRRLIQRNLPALLEEQRRREATPPVQPPASETVR